MKFCERKIALRTSPLESNEAQPSIHCRHCLADSSNGQFRTDHVPVKVS